MKTTTQPDKLQNKHIILTAIITATLDLTTTLLIIHETGTTTIEANPIARKIFNTTQPLTGGIILKTTAITLNTALLLKLNQHYHKKPRIKNKLKKFQFTLYILTWGLAGTLNLINYIKLTQLT